MSRSFAVGMLAIFALAWGLRVAHLKSIESAWEGTQVFSLARGDSAHHWREAQDILDQDFWLRDRVPWKGPAYSYLLAGLMQAVGREPSSLRWPMAFLGALNCALLVLWSRRFLSPFASTLAGVLVATHGLLILYDGELFFPTWLITLNLGAMLLLTRDTIGRGTAIGAGLLLGIATLTHPVYLLAAVAVAATLARQRRVTALWFLAAVLLLVGGHGVRNLTVRGEPVLVSWSGGVNLYIGNQPGFEQTSGQGTAAWGRVLATPTDAGQTRPSQIDRTYTTLTRKQFFADPLGGLAQFGEKLALVFSPLEIANNFRLYELRELSPVLRATMGRVGNWSWPFGLLVPLALIGLWQRRHDSPTPLVLAWSLGLVASMVLAFCTARYRLPIVFLLAPWAAATLEAIWHRRSWRLGLVATALSLAMVGLGRSQSTLPPPWTWSQVQVEEAQGRLDAARAWADRALADHPHDTLLQVEAAGFFARIGDRAREQELLDSALGRTDLEPDLRSHALEQAARVALARGELARAHDLTRRALDVAADDATWRGAPYFAMDLVPSTSCRLRLLLAEVLWRQGDRAQAHGLARGVQNDCPDGESFQTRYREWSLRDRP